MSGESMRKVVGITVGTSMSVSAVANALKGSASGNPIRLDDVSPLEHEMAVHCEGWSANPLSENMVGGIVDLIDMNAEGGKVLFVERCEISEPSEEDPDQTFNVQFTDGSFAAFLGKPTTPIEQGMAMWVDEQFLYYAENKANGATVKKYGKNLFDVGGVADYFVTTSITIISIDRENQTITANSNTDGSQLFVNTKKRYPRGTYTAQAAKNTNGNPRILVRLYDESGLELTNSSAMVVGMTYNEWHKGWFKDASSVTFTIPSEAAYWCFGLVSTNLSGTITTFSNIQVELGSTATEYEKVHCEPLTADENGNVSIIGNGEDFTLIAESGVTISAEYNRDINKAFAEIQQAIATMGAAAATIPEEV